MVDATERMSHLKITPGGSPYESSSNDESSENVGPNRKSRCTEWCVE